MRLRSPIMETQLWKRTITTEFKRAHYAVAELNRAM